MLSKRDSNVIKGAAILFMLAHHLFGFPGRIPPGLSVHPLIAAFPIEAKIAMIGKVCVSLFLFISGYAFGLKPLRQGGIPSVIVRRLARFLSVYWVNFAVFISAGLFFFNIPYFGPRHFFPTLFFNLLGLRLFPPYPGEWWFVNVYIIAIVFLWPLLELASRRGPGSVIACSAVLLGLARFQPDCDFFLWQTSFACGFIFSRYNLYEITHIGLWGRSGAFKGASLVCSLAGIILLAVDWSNGIQYFLITPFLIPFLLQLASSLRLGGCMAFLGRYSGHMWLNHTFFFYYFFREDFYKLKYSLVIFGTALLASLAAALVTDFLSRPLLWLVQRWAPSNNKGVLEHPIAESLAAEKSGVLR